MPNGGYPMLSKKLGAPLGPREQISPHKWRRRFAHATATVDLNDPLGGSRVVFQD
jgi:hypothetical protein